MQIKNVTDFTHFRKFCDMRKKPQIIGNYFLAENCVWLIDYQPSNHKKTPF